MKKRLWLRILVLLMALPVFYGCHDEAKNFSSSKIDDVNAGVKVRRMAADDAKNFSSSKILYSSKCSSCHNLIEPSRFDKETWQLHIERYGKKMTAEEKRVLLNYLTSSE